MRLPILAAFLLGFATSAPAGEDEAVEVFSYSYDGAPLGAIAARVTAKADGTCDVVFKDGVTGRVRLTPEDLETFEKLVAEADLPVDNPGAHRMHAIVATLRVTRDGQSREFRIADDGRTESLSRWIFRVMREADYLQRLEEGKDIYLACSVVNPRCQPGPDSVLHPEAFREPLARLLEREDDTDRLRAVVAALSCVTNPEEWYRLLDLRLRSEDDAKVDALVNVIANPPFPGNELSSHTEALLKLLLATLEREYPDMMEMPKRSPRRMAAASITGALGHERYKPAIPFLVGQMERCTSVEDAGGFPDLARMGQDALDPLARLRASPEAGVRLSAVRTVGLVLECNPSHGRNKLSDEEQRAILRRLREEFAPKVREMAESDPEPWVRKWASRTLRRIEYGWVSR